jgi:hypothetical protein
VSGASFVSVSFRLVRGGDGFGFLRFHFFTAAGKLALAGFGAERFGAAFGTAVSFSQLACHDITSCKGVLYFLISMGWPQQVMVPLPPLVIIISAPHLAQRYLLPT